MKKSKELICKIKERESSPQFLPNFFNDNEITFFIKCFNDSLEKSEYNTYRLDNQEDKTNDITSIPANELKEKVINCLKERMSPVINPNGDLNISFDIAFHANKKAYGIHTDSGYDDNELIFKQGIIPLSVSPKNKITHTVLLKQKCYFSSSFPMIIEDLEAQKDVEDLDFKYEIPIEVYKKYWSLSEQRIKQMKGFSIEYPFEWKIGDTVVWDRSHIHCSSDFEATGVEYKLGLMWISRIEKGL